MSNLQIVRETFAVKGAEGAKGVIVRLAGDADVDHAVELAAALDEVREGSPRLVVLDLSGLAFISSMSIGTLFTFAQKLSKAGGEARLAAANADVGLALARCRADQMMKVFPTVAAACAA